jgi:hypothetical protein
MSRHIMLDLETLGTGPNALVLSIGAVVFDPDASAFVATPDNCFHFRLDVGVQQRVLKRDIDADTVMWWMQQPDEARTALRGPGVHPNHALAAFTSFIGANLDGLWGNGADFDNVILGSLYASCSLTRPWSYGKNRCFRTLKSLKLPKKYVAPVRQGTHHNALDDAIYQTEVLYAIKNALDIAL